MLVLANVVRSGHAASMDNNDPIQDTSLNAGHRPSSTSAAEGGRDFAQPLGIDDSLRIELERQGACFDFMGHRVPQAKVDDRNAAIDYVLALLEADNYDILNINENYFASPEIQAFSRTDPRDRLSVHVIPGCEGRPDRAFDKEDLDLMIEFAGVIGERVVIFDVNMTPDPQAAGRRLCASHTRTDFPLQEW